MSTMIWVYKTFEELSKLELYQILKLRSEVFVVEQNCNYQDLDELDFHSLHLIGFQDSEMMAYARILPPNTAYKEVSIGRILIKKNLRGKKIGNAIMKISLQIIENQFKNEPIKLNAQEHLKTFYERYGFHKTSEPYLVDDILHIEMLKT